MITVKEEFLSHPKTLRAVKLGGYSTLALWLALKGYVAAANSDGFIPRDVVALLPGVPAKWSKAMTALIECGTLRPDGVRGAGLVDVVEHGYKLHDYEDHGLSAAAVTARRERERAKKRRQRVGHVPGDTRGDTRGTCPRGHEGGQHGDVPGDYAPARSQAKPSQILPADAVPDPPRARAREAPSERRRAADSDSEPEPWSLAPDPTPPDRETICPLDLGELAEQHGLAAQFAEKYQVPEDAVRAAVGEFAAYWTLGGGAGKTRRNWMARLRQRLHELGQQHKLGPPPGLVVHEVTSVDPERHRRAMARARAIREQLDREQLDRQPQQEAASG